MKTIFLFLFISLVCNVGFSQLDSTKPWYSIKAFVPQWKGAIAELIVDGEVVSREISTGDMYSYNGIFTIPKLGVLHFQKRGGSLYVPLFIERGLIRVRTQTQFNLIPYGTPTNDAYGDLVKRWDSLLLSSNSLPAQAVKDKRRQLAAQFIRQQPASLISLKLLDDLFYLDATASDTLYYNLFSSMSEPLKASATGQKLGEEVVGRFATAVGKPAPELILPDLSKNPHPLYRTGSFTLLNFWASWCAPCRKEHPELKRLLAVYGAKGFSIIGISLDTSPALWQKAVRDERLSWQQLGDLKGWESPVAKQYGIKSIPANFLLNAAGVIVSKNLSLDSLQKRLATELQ